MVALGRVAPGPDPFPPASILSDSSTSPFPRIPCLAAWGGLPWLESGPNTACGRPLWHDRELSMFFPYNTDAPLYHPPITTGVMIAISEGMTISR